VSLYNIEPLFWRIVLFAECGNFRQVDFGHIPIIPFIRTWDGPLSH
jgi:hypothetical protein